MEEDALLDSCGVISERGRRPLVRPRGFVRSAAHISPYPQVAQPAFHRLPHQKYSTCFSPFSKTRGWPATLVGGGTIGALLRPHLGLLGPFSCGRGRNAFRRSEIAGPPEWPTVQEDRGAMGRAAKPQLTIDLVLRCSTTVNRQPSGR